MTQARRDQPVPQARSASEYRPDPVKSRCRPEVVWEIRVNAQDHVRRDVLSVLDDLEASGRLKIDLSRAIYKDTETPFPYGMRRAAHADISRGVAMIREARRLRRMLTAALLQPPH